MEQTPSPNTITTDKLRWLVALALTFVFSLFGLLYVTSGYAGVRTLELISYVAASTASLLFATALSMGSVSHFTGWPNMRAGFQKQIGITAFLVSLLYTATLPILYPELYWTGLPGHFFSIDVLLGVSAMGIFTAMVLINTPLIAPHVNLSTIYLVLGLGYVGYALLVIRAIFLEYPLWVEWFVDVSGLPPGRLLLSSIAFAVLALRVVVAIDKHRQRATR